MLRQLGDEIEAYYAARQRRRPASYLAPMSEINVTPLVDVMLVLLIVFMVAAPLMTVGVPIELPADQGEAAAGRHRADHRLGRAGRQGLPSETEIELDTLIAKLEAIAKNGYEERIFVRGDTRRGLRRR